MTRPRMLPTAALSLHSEAALVPEMPADQYAAFLADVKARGIVTPIEVIPGTRTVIEGRTRLRAATDAELPAVPVVDADLGADGPVVYMIRAALLRRQLTSGQRAALAVELEAKLAGEAKERQREAGRNSAAKRAAPQLVAIVPQATAAPTKPAPAPVKARDQAAALAGTSARYVQDAKALKASAPAVFEQVKAGKVSLPEAKRVTTKPAPAAPAPAAAGKRPDQLAPCPFCGAKDVRQANTPPFWVFCPWCQATGPKPGLATSQEARSAWNKRVAVKGGAA